MSYSNDTSKKLFGLPAKPNPLKQWSQYFEIFENDAKTLVPDDQTPLYRVLNGEKVVNHEYVIIAKGQAAHKVSINGQRLLDCKNNKLGAVISINDLGLIKLSKEDF